MSSITDELKSLFTELFSWNNIGKICQDDYYKELVKNLTDIHARFLSMNEEILRHINAVKTVLKEKDILVPLITASFLHNPSLAAVKEFFEEEFKKEINSIIEREKEHLFDKIKRLLLIYAYSLATGKENTDALNNLLNLSLSDVDIGVKTSKGEIKVLDLIKDLQILRTTKDIKSLIREEKLRDFISFLKLIYEKEAEAFSIRFPNPLNKPYKRILGESFSRLSISEGGEVLTLAGLFMSAISLKCHPTDLSRVICSGEMPEPLAVLSQIIDTITRLRTSQRTNLRELLEILEKVKISIDDDYPRIALNTYLLKYTLEEISEKSDEEKKAILTTLMNALKKSYREEINDLLEETKVIIKKIAKHEIEVNEELETKAIVMIMKMIEAAVALLTINELDEETKERIYAASLFLQWVVEYSRIPRKFKPSTTNTAIITCCSHFALLHNSRRIFEKFGDDELSRAMEIIEKAPLARAYMLEADMRFNILNLLTLEKFATRQVMIKKATEDKGFLESAKNILDELYDRAINQANILRDLMRKMHTITSKKVFQDYEAYMEGIIAKIKGARHDTLAEIYLLENKRDTCLRELEQAKNELSKAFEKFMQTYEELGDARIALEAHICYNLWQEINSAITRNEAYLRNPNSRALLHKPFIRVWR